MIYECDVRRMIAAPDNAKLCADAQQRLVIEAQNEED